MQGDNNFCSLCVLVYVCTLTEKVLYEGLGHRTEMDVNPAPIASALQWQVSIFSIYSHIKHQYLGILLSINNYITFCHLLSSIPSILYKNCFVDFYVQIHSSRCHSS